MNHAIAFQYTTAVDSSLPWLPSFFFDFSARASSSGAFESPDRLVMTVLMSHDDDWSLTLAYYGISRLAHEAAV